MATGKYGALLFYYIFSYGGAHAFAFLQKDLVDLVEIIWIRLTWFLHKFAHLINKQQIKQWNLRKRLPLSMYTFQQNGQKMYI